MQTKLTLRKINDGTFLMLALPKRMLPYNILIQNSSNYSHYIKRETAKATHFLHVDAHIGEREGDLQKRRDGAEVPLPWRVELDFGQRKRVKFMGSIGIGVGVA